MELFKAILLFIWATLCYIDFKAPYSMIYRPVVAAPITGLILGDPYMGTLIGAQTGLIYLGVVEVGGALPPDPTMGSIVATILMIEGHLPITQLGSVLLIAIPVSIVSSYWFGVVGYTIPIAFLHAGDRAAEKGQIGTMTALHLGWYILSGPIAASLLLIFIFFPEMATALAYLPAWINNGMYTVASVLTAVGLGMLLNVSYRPQYLGFFILGFAFAAYFKLDIVGIVVLIAGIVFVVMNLVSRMETRK